MKKAKSSSKLKEITFTHHDVSIIMSRANASLLEAKDDILKCADYGPIVSDMGMEPNNVINRVITHRFVKKLYDTSIKNDGLRTKAFDQYQSYEAEIASEFSSFNPFNECYTIQKARLQLHSWFKGFKVNLRNTDHLDFTSGESFFSMQGETSVIAKLSLRKHWTTTWNCLDDTIDLIYYNPALKRASKQLIGQVSKADRREYYLRGSTYPKKIRNKLIFRWLLLERVLTIVDGARAETVPKDAEKDRFINVEATFPMLLQRLVAFEIRSVLSKHGNGLDNLRASVPKGKLNRIEISSSAQRLHGRMIQDSGVSTIDFSNASDSTLCNRVSGMFPNVLVRLLMKYRSHYVLFRGSNNEITNFEPVKLSSMGNGYTFEVMTALLYAVSSTLDPLSRVYGDDVIITNEHANEFVSLALKLGYKTNMNKTFIGTPFRESCGYFFHDDVGYITSFDFHPCERLIDVILNHNKLHVILESHGDDLKPHFRAILQELKNNLNACIPTLFKGPAPICSKTSYENIGRYAYDKNWRRKQTSNPDLVLLRKKVLDTTLGVWENGTQLPDFWQRLHYDSKDFTLIITPMFVPKGSSVENWRNHWSACLKSGTAVKAVIKGEGEWSYPFAFVSPLGSVTLLRNMRSNVIVRSASVPAKEHVEMKHTGSTIVTD